MDYESLPSLNHCVEEESAGSLPFVVDRPGSLADRMKLAAFVLVGHSVMPVKHIGVCAVIEFVIVELA